MRSIASKTYQVLTSRTVFGYIYAVVSILWFFPLLGTYVDIISKLCFIWGAALIVWNIFARGKLLEGPHAFLRVLLLLAYCVTIVLNYKFTLYMGIKHLIYNGINLMLIYVLSADSTEKNGKKTLYLFDETIIWVATLSAVISLIMFVFLIAFTFKQGHILLKQGFVENRLYGIFTSPNTGALFMLLSMSAMMINSAIRRGNPFKWKISYFIACIPQLIYISLSLSRGGTLTAVALIVMVGLTCLLPMMYQRRKKVVRTCVVGGLATLMCVAAFFGVSEVFRTVLAEVPALVHSSPQSHPEEQDPDAEKPEIPKIQFERTEEEVSNGRFSIWVAGLHAWKQAPIFGIADADVYHGEDTATSKISTDLMPEISQRELRRSQGNMHNAFVQVLVYSGIVGFVIFVILAVSIAVRYLRFLIVAKKDEFYYIIATIFSLLAALVVNALVESHLLYNRQDPYGVLFWFFVGIGLFLMERHLREEKQKEGGAEVYICDTPYQLINTLALVQEHRTKACLSDLYIYDQFKNAEDIAASVRELQLFDHVYVFRRYKHYTGLRSKLITLVRMQTPFRMLKRHCRTKLSSCSYDRIYMACVTPFIDSVKLINPQAEVCQYEDGLGSYYIDDLEGHCRSNFFKFWCQRLFGQALNYGASTIYLHQPKAYAGKAYEHIYPLSVGPDESTMQKVFSYQDNELYRQSRCVYLTQPLSETKAGETAAELEKRILSDLPDNVLVRVHPRQDPATYSDYTVDTLNNLWELECQKQISAEHVLIGAFSTAQFTPKMLFDIEPTVIFLYRLFDGAFDNADKMVDTLKQMYRDPEKIMVVDSVEQFTELLKKLEDR